MRSVPACYPNVDLNTTERWFENFHFCNLLSLLSHTWEKPAVVSKSGTISPSDPLGWWGCGGDRTREEREEWEVAMKRARLPTGACGGSKPSVSARGFGSTYRNLRALEADPSAATETKGGGTLDNCWRISQPIGMGSKELTVRNLEVGLSSQRCVRSSSDSYLGGERLHASPITYDWFHVKCKPSHLRTRAVFLSESRTSIQPLRSTAYEWMNRQMNLTHWITHTVKHQRI